MVPGSVAFSDRRILHVELQAPPVDIQKGPSTLVDSDCRTGFVHIYADSILGPLGCAARHITGVLHWLSVLSLSVLEMPYALQQVEGSVSFSQLLPHV